MKNNYSRSKFSQCTKKFICLFLTLCLALIMVTWTPTNVDAAETSGDTLTIRIGDQTYENITSGSTIKGDFNLKDLTFWVDSVNGNKLENVGNQSGVTDAMGRNPLEVATATSTDTALVVTLIYHAEDDPVISNQSHSFTVVGITFTNSDKPVVDVPTVAKVKNVKATANSKALKITWKKASVDGYQIQYSTSKTFKSAKKVTVKGTKVTSTINKLKSKKTYYVRIRAYKNYNDELGNKQTVYGKWVTIKQKTN